MDRPPSPLFRQVALEAASGTQIGAPLATHWRGVAAFTSVAIALLAALILFVSFVEYSPVHRVAAFVDAPAGPVRMVAPRDGRIDQLAVVDGAMVRKGDLLAIIGSDRLQAAQDGRVAFASLAEGGSVAVGQPLFTITPRADPLVVRLVLASTAVESVRPGVNFRLALRADPQQRFRLFDAKVESVDEVGSPAGAAMHAGADANEPTFVVTASLAGSGLRGADGALLPLTPGMPADALLPSEPRSVLAWLLDPMRRHIDHSLGLQPPVAEARP
jgi:multidrug resistance efflux pump